VISRVSAALYSASRRSLRRAVCFAAVTLLFIFKPCEARPYILLVWFICLPPEPRTYRWRTAGGTTIVFVQYVGALEQLHNNQQQSPHRSLIFYGGAKSPKFWPNLWYHSCSERRHFRPEDFFGILKTFQGPMVGVPHGTNRVEVCWNRKYNCAARGLFSKFRFGGMSQMSIVWFCWNLYGDTKDSRGQHWNWK